MPSRLGKLILFLSSYIPLFAMFLIVFWGRPFVVWGMSVALVLGALGLALFFYAISKQAARPYTPVDVRRSDSEAMSYMVTYLLPFLAINLDETRQALALLLFFIVLGIIYVNSNMVHINPVLNLLDFSLYEVALESGATYVVLSRHRLVRNEAFHAVELGDDVLAAQRADA